MACTNSFLTFSYDVLGSLRSPLAFAVPGVVVAFPAPAAFASGAALLVESVCFTPFLADDEVSFEVLAAAAAMQNKGNGVRTKAKTLNIGYG